jgi:hypothetical protein
MRSTHHGSALRHASPVCRHHGLSALPPQPGCRQSCPGPHVERQQSLGLDLGLRDRPLRIDMVRPPRDRAGDGDKSRAVTAARIRAGLTAPGFRITRLTLTIFPRVLARVS